MFDFQSAFLNGKLEDDEEVFMEQLPEYEEADCEKFVLLLYKALYGLKQAGRKWYEVVCKLMTDLGFCRCNADPAVFYKHKGRHIVVITIHVDDCTIMGDSKAEIEQCKQVIKA